METKNFIILAVIIAAFALATIVYMYLIQPATKCGNQVCEIGEDGDNCCIDCGCYKPSYVCNLQKNKCEYKQISLTDERAMELAKKYFEEQGLNVTYTKVLGIFTFQNKLIKMVVIDTEGSNAATTVRVTEDGKVTVVPESPGTT
jgi:hypothetical protein